MFSDTLPSKTTLLYMNLILIFYLFGGGHTSGGYLEKPAQPPIVRISVKTKKFVLNF